MGTAQNGVNYNFTESSFLPVWIPNRLLATSTQPAGSAAWNQTISSTLTQAQQSIQTAAAPVAVAAALASNAAMATVAPSPAAPVNAAFQPATPAPTAASPAQPLAAANEPSPSAPAAQPLTVGQLQPIVNAAIADWAAAGLSSATVDVLRKVQFSIADLSGSYLGWTQGNQITIDADAAGYGWFVDATPGQNDAFRPTGIADQLQAVDPRAVDQMDLLTVVEHELGLAAGLTDLNPNLDNLMSSTLSAGVRREVSTRDIDAALAVYQGGR